MKQLLIFFILILTPKALASVSDGQPVSAAVTNAAFMDKNGTTTFTTAIADIQGGIETKSAVDSTSTGTAQNVTLVAPITIYTNASLASIQNITLANRVDASLIVIRNNTGAAITLKHLSGGTASLQINTGTGADLSLPNLSSASMYYDTVNSKWQVTSPLAGRDVSASNITTGTLIVANGGTGQTTLTNHGVLIGAGTSGITQLGVAGAGTVLTGVASSDPAFSTAPTLGINGSTTGQLLLANGGGSGASVTVQNNGATSAYNFNLPTTAGSSGQVLTSAGGISSAMTWSTPASSLGNYNFILNGGFDYWQVGTSNTVTATGGGSPAATYLYQADQWYVNNILGGGTVEGIITYSQATGVTNGSLYGAKVQITTAPTGTGIQNGTELYTVLSNRASIPLYGQTASFTVLVKAFSNVNQVGCQFYYATSEAKPTVAIGSEQTVTVNTSTFTSCTINGQALGTSQTTAGVIGVRIRITGVSSGHTYDLNNGFVVEQAMLNLGSLALSFQREFNEPSAELKACQYFYEMSANVTVNQPVNNVAATAGYTWVGNYGNDVGGDHSFGSVFFKTEKRVAPSISYWDWVGNASKVSTTIGAGTRTDNTTAISATGISTSNFYVDIIFPNLAHAAVFQWVADSRI